MSKKEKEKVTYYDDGSTIVDMSAVNESRQRKPLYQNNTHIKSTTKEKLDTFFQAFKMMLIPTIVVIGILAVLFLLFYLITR